MKISYNKVSKSFLSNGSKTDVIDKFSYEFRENKITSIIGANGTGKSTILNLAAGLIEPDSGSIRCFSEFDQDAELKIGMQWQDYRESLLPWYDIIDNVTLPLKIQGFKRKDREEKARDLIDKFKIGFDLKKRVYELSGGQQQLICLIRNLVYNPNLLLLDEPISALDRNKSWDMLNMLQDFQHKELNTVLFVSHDIDESIFIADEILLLKEPGRFEVYVNDQSRPRQLESLYSDHHIYLRNAIMESQISKEK